MAYQRDMFDQQMDLMDQLHNEKEPLWTGLKEDHESFDALRKYAKDHPGASRDHREQWLYAYMEERYLDGKGHSQEWESIARTMLHR